MPDPNAQPAQSKLVLFVVGAFAVCNVILGLTVYSWSGGYGDDGGTDDYGHAEDTAACNVAGIDLRGELVTYAYATNATPGEGDDSTGGDDLTASENVTAQIRSVEEDPEAKAIMLVIDSYGGSPVAAEEIAEALRRATKPAVAVIREAGDSAAYWAATGADTIFASANSDVGSIGVTSSYVDNSQQNERSGLRYVTLSSGKFKDAGDPNRPLTPEERDLFLRDIQKVHDNFVAAVAKNRNMPVENVRELADGSAMLGGMALEKGLIDKIGLYDDAVDYVANLIGEKAVVCY